MDQLNFDQDIFSPIRFDASFADSSNNSESSISVEMTPSFMNDKNKEIFEFCDIRVKEQKKELKSNSDSFGRNMQTKESKVLECGSPISSQNSSKNSRKSSVNSKTLGVHKKKCGKDDILKGNSGKLSESHPGKKEKAGPKETLDFIAKKSDASEKNIKKPMRPTSLLTSKSKNNAVKSNDKKEDIVRKSASTRNVHVQKELFAGASEKGSLLNKHSLDGAKNINSVKSKHSPVEKTTIKHQTLINDSESIKQETSTKHLSNSTCNLPLQSQYEVSVEKMVHDAVSFECDKIRQNMCSQQFHFYLQLNKLKEEMEREHMATTERLCKVIENLMQVNAS